MSVVYTYDPRTGQTYPENYGIIPYTPQPSAAASAAATASKAGGARKIAQSIKEWYAGIKSGKPILNTNFKIPNVLDGAKTIRNAPIWEGGPSLASGANTVSGLYQGAKLLGNMTSAGNADSDYNSILRDVNTSAAFNPLVMSDLTASQKKLLRQAKSGILNNKVDGITSGVVHGIPDILKNAVIGGLTGGIGGAAIGGIGTALNKGAEGYTRSTEDATSKLQALYDTLQNSEQNYNRMKRPQNMVNAGLQSRYFNQLW